MTRALITGAASGVGRATALLSAREPAARLVLVDRTMDRLENVAREASALGAEVITFAADLVEPAACVDAVGVARERLGGLDVLMSIAGISPPSTLLDVSSDDFDHVFAVNTRSLLLLAREAHDMLAASHGSIVATASISATNATPHLGVYSAAKAALLMIVKQLALEWGREGIRCNAVSPGPTVTGLTATAFGDTSDDRQRLNREQRESHIPLGRVSEAEDIARGILFLSSPAARQITGLNLIIDGGLSLALMASTGGGSGYAP